MNPFIVDYKTRHDCWKQVRNLISQSDNIQDKISLALNFWKQAPEQSLRLNWDDCSSWPGPWELLHENEYCVSCHSLGIAYTLMLADSSTFPDVQLKLLWHKEQSAQRMVAHTHDYYLNWGHVDKTHESQLQNVITQNTWRWCNKKWIHT